MSGGSTVRGVGAALALVAVIATGACSSDGEGDPVGSAPAPTASATSATGPLCADEVGDAAPEQDLVSAQLVRTRDRVRVILTQAAAVPSDVIVVWNVGFVSADAERTVDLTTKTAPGAAPIHDLTRNGGATLQQTDPVRLTATAMTTTFPVEPIDDLGPGTRWYAELNIDGFVVDLCPGGRAVLDILDVVPLELPARW
ncbi:MAG: hypothetical protein ACT4PP_12640 [Sporichthyaceae bacterium]